VYLADVAWWLPRESGTIAQAAIESALMRDAGTGLYMAGKILLSVGAPVSADDAATKGYVDAVAGAVSSTFAWASNAATIAVTGTGAVAAASNTMTGNCTLTLLGGVDGVRGTFYVKQDGTGSHTLTLTASGRTILRDTGVTDDNPSAGANTVTGYEYEFVTVVGTACVRVRKMPLV